MQLRPFSLTVYHLAQPFGADPVAALLGLGGSASVALLTMMHTEVPATSDGHLVVGFAFQKVKSDAEMLNVDSSDVHVSLG
jgi:hypothetical protein